MNFLKSLTLGAASLFIFSQCGGGADFSKPESVAVAFSKAMGNLDFAGAGKFCTAETAKLLETMGAMTAAMPEDKKKEAKEQAKNIKSAKCTVEGEKAKCTVCCDKDGKDSGEGVELKKDGGKWLVHIDKTGGMGGNTTPDSTPTPEPATDTTAVDTTKK